MNPLARRLDKVADALSPPTARPRVVFGKDSADAEAKLAALRGTGFAGSVMVIRWLDRTEGRYHAVNA